MDIIFQWIQPFQLIPVHHKTGRSILSFFIQLGSRPVKNRHKIISNTFDSVLRTALDRLTVIFNMTVAFRSSKFNLFCDRNRLYHIKYQTICRTFINQMFDALFRPYFSRLHIIHSRNNRTHSRNLTDFIECDRITVSIPTK